MMFGGGFIQTMINTVKGNRAILPSQRQKFMEPKNPKYIRGKNDKKIKFKEISKSELEEAIFLLRIAAQKERRKQNLLIFTVAIIVVILVVVFALFVLFSWDWASSNFFRLH